MHANLCQHIENVRNVKSALPSKRPIFDKKYKIPIKSEKK
jgi:hypothetical protein